MLDLCFAIGLHKSDHFRASLKCIESKGMLEASPEKRMRQT